MEMTETGIAVYNRTYSRTNPDGTKESWPETVRRVVNGNLVLGGGKHLLPNEQEDLIEMMESLKIIPAGRHLWASGVPGRQYLFNCHVSGWTDRPSDHFEFMFLRLMEGGGVGSNYSNTHIPDNIIENRLRVHIVCDPDHPDYEEMNRQGLISHEFGNQWQGAFAIEDSREGWAEGLVDFIDTYYRDDVKHVDRVYDVSRIRSAGTRLRTFGGRASGPAPFARMMHEVSDVMNSSSGMCLTGMAAMEIDHAIATCVVSGGNRRSARMSIMHWNDPQVGQFIRCKATTGKHWTTNISVEVDDRFFEQIDNRLGDHLWAKEVLKDITEGMLNNGEPGIWNSSFSNVDEPNPVTSTNPCGEIALEEWENCNLGHVNLAAFVNYEGLLHKEQMERAHLLMTRFLIRATYGDVNDPKQAEVLARNRRIGVGHLGFASMLAMSGVRYSESPENYKVAWLLDDMAKVVDEAAFEYCHDLRIPVPVKLRTVAPTGTVAKMPGVSEGIHPIFAKYFLRRIRFSVVDEDQRNTLEDYRARGFRIENCRYAPNTVVLEIPTKDILMDQTTAIHGEHIADRIVESSADLSLEKMLKVQEMYQTHWADNAVSYTANIDPKKYTPEIVANTIREFGPRLKGMTVFPDMGMAQSPYERLTKQQYESYSVTTVADSVDETCSSGACPVR